jgi:polysaccharide export outer membrane protein
MRTGRYFFVLLLLLAGCSQQDFSRPIVDAPFKGVAIGKSRSESRTERLPEVLSEWNKKVAGIQQEYFLGPGDVLDVSIYALEEPGQTTHLNRTVGKEGTISLPWVGDVPIQGLTLRQLEERIRAAYANRFIKNPQISIEIKDHRSVAVVVTGAVRTPGVYYLTASQSTVLEILAMAGGLKDDASDDIFVIRAGVSSLPPAALSTNAPAEAGAQEIDPSLLATGTAMVPVDLKQLIDNSDLRQNVDVRGGDIVAVRSVARSFVYVLGYVARPGAYEMRGSEDIDALRAVALAGGLLPTARAENSFVVRETTNGQSILAVDLVQVAHGAKPSLVMEPGDTLVVGSGLLARLSEFVRPSASVGASYTPSLAK